MIPTQIALIVFACAFGGALLGMWLRIVLPAHHLSEHSTDVIKLGVGLIANMAALVLGLLIATAKSSYDTEDTAIKHSAAKVLLLDRVLSNYGPETKETRDLLRQTVANTLAAIWAEDNPQSATGGMPEATLADRNITSRILQLAPHNDTQRGLQSQALQIGGDIMETRWLALSGGDSVIPVPFLVVVVFWVTIIFVSFGLVAPRNPTVVGALFLCALSVAGSLFLILEMNQPFEGLIKISDAPLRYTLAHLGR